MTRLQKLIVLTILSLSVYFIYQKNSNSKYQVININDYKSQNNSYIKYYEKELLKTKKSVVIDNGYSKNNQTIDNILFTIKSTSEIKAKLINTDQLIISLGYNDILFNVILEERMTEVKLNTIVNDIESNYNKTIKEIKKYYHKPIIVIGYPYFKTDNYYLNQGLKKLNNRLNNNKDIQYINIYSYFNNYKKISQDKYQKIIYRKIISKTLEIS